MSAWHCYSSRSFKIWFLWIFVHQFRSSIIFSICTIWLLECSWKAHINNIRAYSRWICLKICVKGERLSSLHYWAELINHLIYSFILVQFRSAHFSGGRLCTKCRTGWECGKRRLTQLSALRADAILAEPLGSGSSPQSHSFVLHQWKTDCLRVIPGEASL